MLFIICPAKHLFIVLIYLFMIKPVFLTGSFLSALFSYLASSDPPIKYPGAIRVYVHP